MPSSIKVGYNKHMIKIQETGLAGDLEAIKGGIDKVKNAGAARLKYVFKQIKAALEGATGLR